jgi:hypothetical protein
MVHANFGIQLSHVQCYRGSTVKMVLSCKIFTFNEANTYVALPNACRFGDLSQFD